MYCVPTRKPVPTTISSVVKRRTIEGLSASTMLPFLKLYRDGFGSSYNDHRNFSAFRDSQMSDVLSAPMPRYRRLRWPLQWPLDLFYKGMNSSIAEQGRPQQE